MREKKPLTTKRGQWHKYRTFTLTLVLDPTLNNLNSNVIRLGKIDIEKKKIKLEKKNDNPTYLSDTIHANFPRLQGQPFSLYHMEQNKPEMKALPPDVDNVVALLKCEELKRSHLYVKPQRVLPSTVLTDTLTDEEFTVAINSSDVSFVPNEPTIHAFDTHLLTPISYGQLLMDAHRTSIPSSGASNAFYQMLFPHTARSVMESVMEPSSMIPKPVSDMEDPLASSKTQAYSIALLEDDEMSYSRSIDCVDGTVEVTPAKRIKQEANHLTKHYITYKTEIKADQVIHDAAVGITCSVCHKILLDPVTLPCLDSFCLKCLEPYLLSPTPACPRCQTTFFIPQEGLRAMPYNKFTEKVVMLQRICNHDADDKFCDICGPNRFSNQTTAVNLNVAEKYCLECQQKFCTNCLAYHTRMKCTSFHQVVELGIQSSRSVELAQKEKDQFCPIHNAERVQVQCNTCDVLVCGLCHEQNHLTHDCRWFKEDIKVLTKQEIDMKKQMLQNSLRDRQNTIGQLQNELTIRETEIFKIRESVTRKVLQLKEAIDNSEHQLRQDLDNYYTVNVSSLQAEVKEKKKVLSSMMKLERFMQELTEKGSDCDLVQFNATLCQRTDTLLSESFTNLYIDELRLSFLPSSINTEVNNLIGELIRTEASPVRESTEISEIAMPKITSGDVKEFEPRTETDKNAEQRSPSSIVGAPGCSKDDQMFDFAKFLTSLTVRHVMPGAGARVTGITVLGSELFVVRNTSQVYVYKSDDDFTLIRKLTITGSQKLEGLVSCSHYNCLYLCDWSRKINVYRHDPTNNVTTNWSVNGTCYRLSVTRNYNILATMCDIKRIQEFTTHGSFIREISLDSSIDIPFHCVQLSTGNYAVCHGQRYHVGLKSQHRVCIVDQSGRIIQSYGGSRGSGVGQLNFPCHLAVDVHDNVLVVDRENNRVQLLSPTLTYLGNVVIPRHALKHPDTLYFNELNHLLYIGEYTGGRIFVLDVK